MLKLMTQEECYLHHRQQFETYQRLLHTKGRGSRRLRGYYKKLCSLAALRAEKFLDMAL